MIRLLYILAFLLLSGCSGTKEITKVNRSASNDALEKLSQQVGESPGNYEAFFELAQLYSERGEVDKAITYADSALQINSEHQDARYLKAELNYTRGEVASAYQDFLVLLSVENPSMWFDRIIEVTGLQYSAKQLTRGNFDNTHPSYDPSGNRIVFQSNKNLNWDINVVDLNSEEITQVTNSPLNDESPVYANPSTVLFTRQQNNSDNKRDIHSINIDSFSENALIVHPADDWNPAPTSNGESLLFVSDRDIDGNYSTKIFTFDFATKQAHSLLSQDFDYSFPCVLKSKDQFLFTANNDKNYSLFNASLDGSDVSRLTSHNMDFGAPKYSPDGRKVVFFSRVDGNYDIYELDLRSEKLNRLTSGKSKDLSPSYSPDGSKIVYYSDRNGRYHIYEIDLNRSVSKDELMERMRFVVASSND